MQEETTKGDGERGMVTTSGKNQISKALVNYFVRLLYGSQYIVINDSERIFQNKKKK